MPDTDQPGPHISREHFGRIMDAARQRAPAAGQTAPGVTAEETARAPEGAARPGGGPAGAAPGAVGPEAAIRAEAAALHQEAIAAIQAGDTALARTRLEESLALERGIAVPADMAATLVMLGQVLFSQNEREPGLAMARESLAILEERAAPEASQVAEIVQQMEALVRQDAPGGSRDLLRQGIAALQDGDGEQAGELLDASLQAAVAAGDGAVAAGALHHLGLLLFSAGHLPDAEAALRDSLELNRTLADEPALAAGLALLGQVVIARGDRAEGLRLLRESLLTWNAAGMPETAAQIKALIAEIKAEGAGPGPAPPPG